VPFHQHAPGRRDHGLFGLRGSDTIKLTPLIFVAYLLITGRIRAAATAAAPVGPR